MFSKRFMLFPTSNKKVGVKKNVREGGVKIFYFYFFLEKTLLYYFILRFMLFSALKKIEILKSAASLNG